MIYCSCACGHWVVSLNTRSMGLEMFSGQSVVKHGGYQLSFSEGLTESDRSAMHQHTTLLSHITVTALRPEERRDRVTTETRSVKWQCWGSRQWLMAPSDYTRWLPTRCWGPALLGGWSQSRHAAQHVCHGAPLHTHTHTICSQLDTTCLITGYFTL